MSAKGEDPGHVEAAGQVELEQHLGTGLSPRCPQTRRHSAPQPQALSCLKAWSAHSRRCVSGHPRGLCSSWPLAPSPGSASEKLSLKSGPLRKTLSRGPSAATQPSFWPHQRQALHSTSAASPQTCSAPSPELPHLCLRTHKHLWSQAGLDPDGGVDTAQLCDLGQALLPL